MDGIAKWQHFDGVYFHCKDCSALFKLESLREGRCGGCRKSDSERRSRQLENADRHSLAKAAREFLVNVQGAGKDTKRMSTILDAFFQAQGGPEQFARQLSDHWDKVNGKNLTEAEQVTYEYSPKMALQWAELLMRHQAKDDEQRTLDVSGLSEEDLIGSLRELADRLVMSNAEFRKMCVQMAMQADPTLINTALDAAGKPALEAEGVVQIEQYEPDDDAEAFKED